MKNSTKFLLSVPVVVALAGVLNAQTYCTVTTATAYTADMPGVTNVTLGSINRTSADLECGGQGCNSVVTAAQTQQTTSLQQGQIYSFSITHTKDAVSFGGAFNTVRNNIRVWIDFNQNGTLNDAGEEVVSIDYATAGTSTANIAVPANATLGTTRMRVTSKMSQDGGHTVPTPCDNPADPGGYHGEIEDYTITITASSGIQENVATVGVKAFPNPFTGSTSVSYTLASKETITLEVYNLLGEKVGVLVKKEEQKPGSYSYEFNASNADASGIYFVRLQAGNAVTTQKLVEIK